MYASAHLQLFSQLQVSVVGDLDDDGSRIAQRLDDPFSFAGDHLNHLALEGKTVWMFQAHVREFARLYNNCDARDLFPNLLV